MLILAFVGAGSLSAQRRTTGGGGAAGRGTPGGSSGASSERGSRGGSAARGSGGTRTGSASVTRGSGQSRRPASGKIGAIRNRARAAQRRAGGGVIVTPVYLGACWGCDYWGWYGGYWGWYHGGWWYPADHAYPHEEGEEEEQLGGQGYLPYPYAGGEDAGETFVRRHARRHRAFGAVSAQFFSDDGSTTKAGRFGLEGAIGLFRGELEYSHYAEPVQGGTDHLHTWRVSLGAQPRLGNRAYLVGGVGLRGVVLDRGGSAVGPEGELGVQLLPLRPFGVNLTGRLAGLTWNGYDYFTLRELNTTGSVFIGRVELVAGWHWLKVGGSPAFGGPVVGTRLWF
jgi:hypothetical protein